MQAHEQMQFLQAVGTFVRQEIQKAVLAATLPLQQQIEFLQKQLYEFPEEWVKDINTWKNDFETRIAAIPAGKDGTDGAPGKDGVDGEPGADGKDGTSVDMDQVADVIQNSVAQCVTDALAEWPKPKDGQDGRDGIDGTNGKDGAPGADGLSVDADSVNVFIKVCVDDAVARIPVPAAPVSVVGGFIDRHGHLCHTLSDGSIKTLGLVVGRDGTNCDMGSVRAQVLEFLATIEKPKDGLNGKDGRDGIDGKDGFGFEHFSLEDINGELYLQFTRGDEIKTFLLPHIRYMGIWKAGRYLTGQQTTYEGSQWIALADTETQPGTKDSDWQLCVKRGRDGKDGKDGKPGPEGKPGKAGRDGRDLTQLAFDGTKS